MNLEDLRSHYENEYTPLLRTDFSDDEAWATLARTVTAGVNIVAIDDPRFEDASGPSLAAEVGSQPCGYVLLADARAMQEVRASGEVTVVVVDLSVSPEDAEEFGDVLGREFRSVVAEIASITVNLSLGNADFVDFAEDVQDDGVFRGSPE